MTPCKMLAAATVIALVAVPACDAWATGPAAVLSRTACGPFKAGARSLAPQRHATALGLVMAEPKVVGLIGATGGVGRLCCAALLEQGVSVRAIVRDVQKAKGLLPADCEFVEADMCKPSAGVGLAVAIKGVDALVLATGTTAFPSDKWARTGSMRRKRLTTRASREWWRPSRL